MKWSVQNEERGRVTIVGKEVMIPFGQNWSIVWVGGDDRDHITTNTLETYTRWKDHKDPTIIGGVGNLQEK